MRDRFTVVTVVSALSLLAACGAEADSTTPAVTGRTPNTVVPTEEPIAIPTRFPAITKVRVSRDRNAYTFAVTISSPYDSPQRYADAFRVRSHGGRVFGVRELAHPHRDQQPFTRTLGGVRIPDTTTEVVVEGRDSVHGWGGKTRVVQLRGG